MINNKNIEQGKFNMSRLIELLYEVAEGENPGTATPKKVVRRKRKTTAKRTTARKPTSVVSSDQDQDESSMEYKKYTAYGNVFRLMLVSNPNYSLPPNSPRGLIVNMLRELDETHLPTVKSLQTTFNKIQGFIQDGKNPTPAVKMPYFKNLFKLIFSLLNSPNDKNNTPKKVTKNSDETVVASVFASNSAKAQKAQLVKIKSVGHMLLAKNLSKELPLSGKDETMIRQVISTLDDLDAVSPENTDTTTNLTGTDSDTTTHIPTEVKPDVSSVVSPLKPTEDIQLALEKTEKTLQQVMKKIKSIETPQTSKNITEIPKVEFTDLDASVNPIINEKLATMYKQTEKEFGTEVANNTSKFVAKILQELDGFNGYMNAMVKSLELKLEKTESGFQLNVESALSDTKEPTPKSFVFKQIFGKSSDGKTNVYLDSIQMPSGAQKHGFVKKMFKHQLDLCESMKVDKMSLHANVDVGGYAWFRYGFVPKNSKEIKGIADWMRNISIPFYNALKYDSFELSNFIKDNSPQNPAIQNFVSLIKKGQSSSTQKIISGLLNSCAAEFEKKFSDPKNLDGISSAISTMNFTGITVNKIPYTISYKALLSIQSLISADGVRIIPMLNKLYLNWEGELDMKNLNDTKAYLAL